jgi:hypothetical protein
LPTSVWMRMYAWTTDGSFGVGWPENAGNVPYGPHSRA